MNQAHSVIIRACSWLAVRTRAWIIGLAVIWMAAAPHAAWGQWNGTNPVWTNSNVGIGTAAPERLLDLAVPGVSTAILRINSWGNLSGDTSGGTMFGANIYRDWQGTYRTTNTHPNIGYSGIFLTNGYIIFSGKNGVATTKDAPVALNEYMRIDGTNGNVGIGTTSPQYLLSVNGTIGTKDVIVTNTGWSDYVFRPGYRLRPLSEVGAYIQAHHHLPDIPTEAEVKEQGVSLGEMQSKLLAKIEELTLHMIQMEERNNRLEQGLRESKQEKSQIWEGTGRTK